LWSQTQPQRAEQRHAAERGRFICQKPRAVNRAAQSVGHGQQQQPDAGNQDHGADGVAEFRNDLFQRGWRYHLKISVAAGLK
jgi:hypothetical protein